jgi:PAS domain S-box-containing protein
MIKLDAYFLRMDEATEKKGMHILESVVNMAKSMGLPIIVEGVEAQEQVNFLEDLGCCYIQGYYFYRPMPVEEFERLIADERRVDRRGIEFKSNLQIHPREFLDENIFTDAMLNNVLGPVAIYRWKGDAVDIVRYNQQFFLMVGITIQQINDRRSGIQAYVHPDDRKKLYKILETATRDHMNGGKGVVRVYRPNGSIRWISMQTYFMNETEEGKTFYGSCDDVTEMQFINVDLPGGYHRVTLDENMEFRYVSRNFQDMTGYSESDLLMTFEGKFINMVHPDDVGKALGRMYALKEGKKPEETPFRIRHKEKGYIYVMDQQIVTDLYGEICMMGIAVDVSESMKLRDSMRLLTDYFTDCVAFVRHEGEKWDYELAAYGLGDKLGLDQEAFRQALNSGAFYSWVDESQRDELYRKTLSSIKTGERFQFSCDLILPSGRKQRIQMYTDRVEKNDARVEYICVFHAI